MSATEVYSQLLKIAASGERPHEMLPGRTTKSGRGKTGTVLLQPKPKVQAKRKKKDAYVAPPAVNEDPVEDAPAVAVVKAPGAPKVDINFSVKVGAAQDVGTLPNLDPQRRPMPQGNTAAQVDGSFQPDNNVSGGYGTTTLSEEPNLMRTPAVPGGEDDYGGYVGDIKISSLLVRALKKVAEPQPLLPEAAEQEVAPPDAKAVEEQELQQLLQQMKQQNPAFYAQQAAKLPVE